MQRRAMRVLVGSGKIFLVSLVLLGWALRTYSQDSSGDSPEGSVTPAVAGQNTAAVILETAPGATEPQDQDDSGDTINSDHVPEVKALVEEWRDWPGSENFRITLEYRNYTYFEGEARGDSRDSINEGRFRVEYDKLLRENVRLYLNLLAQADDDDFTHGVFDLDEDDLERSYLNFTEAFVDFYFDSFDMRLGKQIINWGKADVFNPTDNLTPTDYSNLLDEDDMGILAANLNFYWEDWSLQVVGIPLFAPSRLPPRGTRFSIIPPDSPVPIEDPELPPDTIDNAQFGLRVKTTYNGWDFSVSYYDGVNDIPTPDLRFRQIIIPMPEPTPVDVPYVVPIYNRMRAFGADFATVFDKWGLHGEAAQFIFDGDRQDAYFQYVLGLDYKKSDLLFDQDIFIILEYIGLEVTEEGKELETGTPPLDRILVNALATRITYEFSDFTWLELKAAYDFDYEDYYVQPQLAHSVNDNLTVVLGLDLLGGPKETFLGQFRENDRLFAKLIYAF